MELGQKLKEYCIENNIRFFPEYKGWDCILEYHGMLCGVQLKLKYNAKALSQCVENGGVDFKMLVFTELGSSVNMKIMDTLCYGCHVLPIYYNQGKLYDSNELWYIKEYGKWQVKPGFREQVYHTSPKWLFYYRQHPKKRITLPEGTFNIPAGNKSPLTISDWRINTIKLERIHDLRGYLVKADFDKLSMRPVVSFFNYDWRTKHWIMYKKPSLEYAHIADGLIWEAVL